MSLLALALLVALQNPEDLAAELVQDFRGKKVDEKLFRREGPDAAKRMKTEAEGLRITLPAEQKKPVAVGLMVPARLKGDFEITAGYEILHVERPKLAFPGAGFELYLMTDTPTREAIAFYWVLTLKGEARFAISRATTSREGNREYKTDFFPVAEKTGKLRITRSGPDIKLWVLDGDGKEFQELQQLDLGREDVKYVRIAANPGEFASAVDLRLRDVRVRAQALEMPKPKREAPQKVHEIGKQPAAEPELVVAKRFHQDFRGRPVDGAHFLYTGPKARQQIAEGSEGLRITLPAPGVEKQQPTGLVLNSRVAGDWDLTLAYELLRRDRPLDGYGAGMSVYIATDTPTKEAVMLARFNPIEEGEVYSCVRLTTNAAGKRDIKTKYFGPAAPSGKLRVVRKGPVVTMLVAEGTQDEFWELHQVELGTEDLTMVRLAADTGNSLTPVEGYIASVEVRAHDLPNLNLAAAEARPRSPLYGALFSFGILGMAAAACVWWSCRKPRAAPSPASRLKNKEDG